MNMIDHAIMQIKVRIAFFKNPDRGANARFFGGCAFKGPSVFHDGPSFPKQILLQKCHDLM